MFIIRNFICITQQFCHVFIQNEMSIWWISEISQQLNVCALNFRDANVTAIFICLLTDIVTFALNQQINVYYLQSLSVGGLINTSQSLSWQITMNQFFASPIFYRFVHPVIYEYPMNDSILSRYCVVNMHSVFYNILACIRKCNAKYGRLTIKNASTVCQAKSMDEKHCNLFLSRGEMANKNVRIVCELDVPTTQWSWTTDGSNCCTMYHYRIVIRQFHFQKMFLKKVIRRQALHGRNCP